MISCDYFLWKYAHYLSYIYSYFLSKNQTFLCLCNEMFALWYDEYKISAGFGLYWFEFLDFPLKQYRNN